MIVMNEGMNSCVRGMEEKNEATDQREGEGDTFQVYDSQCVSSLFQCYVSKDYLAKLSLEINERCIVHFSWEVDGAAKKMNFTAMPSIDYIETRDIVLPYPYKDLLGQSKWNVRLIPVSSAAAATKVSLLFKRYLSLKNWDEYSVSVFEDINISWQYSWPKLFQIETLSKMVPLFLQSAVLQNHSTILLKIFESYLEFEVSIEGDDCEDTFYGCDLLTPIEVLTTPPKILNEQITEQYSYQNPLNFQENIVERVFYSVEELLNSCASASFVHCSLLLTGTKGSGKSTILKRIKHFIGNKSLSAKATYFESKLQNVKQNYSQVLDYNLSFSSQSDQLQQQKARDIDANSIRTSHFAESLKILLREIFSIPENQIEDILLNTSHVVKIFAIDDLDLLFHPFKHDYSMVSLSGASYLLNQYFQSIAYHLKVVLQFLSRNAFQCKMLFLGTTSYSKAEIPSSQLGCPWFELMLSIPKPSFVDRCHLVYEELQSMASFPFEEIARSDELQSDLFNIFPDLPTSSSSSISSVNQNLMVWAYQIAGLTRGYLPADIAAILKKAIVLKYQRSASSTSPTTGNNELTWEIILESIAMTPLHSIEDLEVTQNYEIAKNLSWNHFGGYSEIKQKLQTILRPFLKQPKAPQPSEGAAVSGGSVTNKGKSLLQQFKFPRGMILHGPSGCGKTFLSKIIGKELNANMITIQSTDILSKYFGETEAKIRKIFQTARQSSPCVLFFDEFDSLAHRRSMDDQEESSHGNIYNRILSTFLNELDGITVPSSSGASSGGNVEHQFVFVIVACKSLDNLDDALIRPGRLQYHVALEYPNEEDVREIFTVLMDNIPFTLDQHRAAQLMKIPHLTASIVSEIIFRMKCLAIKERILLENSSRSGGESVLGSGDLVLSDDHWSAVVEEYLPVSFLSEKQQQQSFQGNYSFSFGL